MYENYESFELVEHETQNNGKDCKRQIQEKQITGQQIDGNASENPDQLF